MSEPTKYVVANPKIIEGDLIIGTPLWIHYIANYHRMALAAEEAAECAKIFAEKMKTDRLDATALPESELIEIVTEICYDETLGREFYPNETEFLEKHQGSIIIDI
jgi:hypothetical protein